MGTHYQAIETVTRPSDETSLTKYGSLVVAATKGGAITSVGLISHPSRVYFRRDGGVTFRSNRGTTFRVPRGYGYRILDARTVEGHSVSLTFFRPSASPRSPFTVESATTVSVEV